MKKPVRVVGPRDHVPGSIPPGVVNTTSRSDTWSRGLSPFFLGPIPLYEGASVPESVNMENAWQYAKVYDCHVGLDGDPGPAYFDWAAKGWQDPKAQRYPMGKGAKPLYTWWEGERLTYIEARKRVYFLFYARAVVKTEAFERLLDLHRFGPGVTLWDFDGYDHHALGMDFKDVLNDETRKMGHAFVLAFLLDKLA